LWVKVPLAYSTATAAGRVDLKGSAGMPPLRQAAIPLAAMQDDSVVDKVL